MNNRNKAGLPKAGFICFMDAHNLAAHKFSTPGVLPAMTFKSSSLPADPGGFNEFSPGSASIILTIVSVLSARPQADMKRTPIVSKPDG